MHVLLVAHHAWPHVGGVETLLDLEVRALLSAGHRVTLLTSDGGTGPLPVYMPNVVQVRITSWHLLERLAGIPYPLFSPQLVPILWREIGRADVVHAHGALFQSSALALLLARLRRVPSVLTDHGGIQQFSTRWATWLARVGFETLGRLSACLANRAIAYNTRIQDLLARLRGRADVQFLANPVSPIFAPPTPAERVQARQALGWDDRPKVLFVGRLIAAKGIHTLCAAADPRYDLVFCGPGDPGQLGPGVQYLPPRPQLAVRQLYHAADVLALPAQVREGFPLVVQEALACGLPVVLGDDPGFAPYRAIPGLHLCAPTPANVRAALLMALQAGRIAQPGQVFPTMREWVEKLFAF
jgi:glycosyltransferase involved in cell wall biosynthesis